MTTEENKIVSLIREKVNTNDERISYLFFNNPMFHQFYRMLKNNPQKSEEIVIDTIAVLCKLNESLNSHLYKKI